VTSLIKTQGRFLAGKALKDLDRYKLGETYKCYYLADDVYSLIWAPRHMTGYGIGAAISWIVVIVAMILIIVGLIVQARAKRNG